MHPRRRIPFFNPANILSLLRIPLAFAVIAVYPSPFWAAVFLSLAALSDWLDGVVARRMKLENPVGAMIDPICDKIFVAILLIFFYLTNIIDTTFLVIFFLRDIYLLAGFLVLGFALSFDYRRSRLEYKARVPGKVVTIVQFCILFAVVAQLPYSWWLMYVLVGASVVAIIDYTRHAVKQLRKKKLL
ncbi:CDP-alcohol phosphatidyltransferase family protein [Candidatus Woesearchaeota archaeon]|nr:CDP-alcohol phosphatidyltransferase family protein [Candidatus Woesearchaeota archaeon]